MRTNKKCCFSNSKTFHLVLGLILNILVVIVAIIIYHSLTSPKACSTGSSYPENIEQPTNNELQP